MFKTILITLALIASVSALVRRCDRGELGPLHLDIEITGCADTTQTCRLVRGRDVVGFIGFEATSEVQALRPEITAYAFSVRAVYELPADRQVGCNWISGTSCPLSAGEFATYELNMPVTDEYPLTKLDIEVRLFDQNNVIQFCTLIESEVVLN